jgi:adenine deaminase
MLDLLEREEVIYLSEMMNFPGVLFKDEEVMKKLEAAWQLGKPVDVSMHQD